MDASPVRLSRSQWAVLLLAGLAYLAWGAVYIHRASFVVDGQRVFCLWDDGMISMTYARNLVRGHGLLWNPGDTPVQGYSNLGVTLMMAVAHLVAPQAHRVSAVVQGLELAALGGTAIVVGSLARRVRPEQPAVAVGGRARHVGLGVGSRCVGPAGLRRGAHRAVARRERARGVRSPSAGPALGVHGRSSCSARGWYCGSMRRLWFVGLGAAALRLPGPRRQRIAASLAVLLVVTGAMLGLSAMLYGDPLPNTVYLKAMGSPRSLVLQSGVAQLGDWLPPLLPALGVAGYGAVRHRREPIAITIAAVVGLGLAYTVWVGGDWAPELGNRLFVPCLPLLWLLVAIGLVPLVERALVDWRPRARGWALAGATLGLSLLASPGPAAKDWFSTGETTYRGYNQRNYERARYLRQHTDLDFVVGVFWAGVPVYFSERPALDSARQIRPPHRPSPRSIDSSLATASGTGTTCSASASPMASSWPSAGSPIVRSSHATTCRSSSTGQVRLLVRRTSLAKVHDLDATVEPP